ncbi:DoxX family protein [Chryseobacterium piperi]|uniref:DoxX family protein n=1 Tax=Chryseobacterium piperi TaxID=558152 RepID=UPI00068ED094|nr:DoxX family protein [Chryseobacterium piperi]ASW75597.1 DoxX family protein [Chryseobacterium piperi]
MSLLLPKFKSLLFAPPKTDLLVIVRIIVGCWIAWYGKDVFISEWFEKARVGFGETGLGFSNPELMLYLAKGSELIFGIFLVLGLLTRLSSAILLVVLSVAVTLGQNWKIFPYDQGEITFFYWLFFVVFLIVGGGRFSLDALLFHKTKA